ncbi:MAG: 30S ribosomal protein S21 [Candidatus Dojkabacteria bacterium]|nr:30S ribosomal protein S21 [Candidatus Dojkabacteria bacterium]
MSKHKIKYSEIHDQIDKENPPKMGLTVIVKNNEVNKAMKILKKKIMNEGLAKEVKRKMFYETGTEKRKREKAEARLRWKRKKEMIDKFLNGEESDI